MVRYVSVPVTVTAGGTTGPKLANTGADVALPALGGIAALGLGAGMIVSRAAAARLPDTTPGTRDSGPAGSGVPGSLHFPDHPAPRTDSDAYR